MKCEIEFLPVGDASKAGDAIVIRYGEPDGFGLMTIDGGNMDSGDLVVQHIRQQFGNHIYINHALLTHTDADHASGLRHILREMEVKSLWLNVPWAFVNETRPYFLDKAISNDRLAAKIAKEYDLITEILEIAQEKNIPVLSPFAGASIGPFHVLSPHREFYAAVVPQFDRTPEPDQKAIEAAGFWIGKQQDPALAKIYEALVAKAHKWIPESWEHERLKDGGITNASNESSVILYGEFENNSRVLLTGDAGFSALAHAVYQAKQKGFPLQKFTFVQIPHHGSRRNVGPTILNNVVGPILLRDSPAQFAAFVSAPKDDDSHPRKMVLNAFIRRGGRIVATQGVSKVHWGGFPARNGYGPAEPIPFSPLVEEYD
jgi:beta-lactamase superfamily II metal-dependent hydrolase